MDVELRHLKALVAIADEGTVTAAAARLHLTQPALSRTLAQLEQRTGVRLVDRGPTGASRRTALTSAGRTLYDHARAILARVDAALADAAAVSRPLRLGYNCALLGRSTTPLLRSWQREHPHVPLELRRRDESTAGLATGDVDVAVVRADPGDPRLRAEALYREDRFAALPDDHPLAGRREIGLAELAGETLVTWREVSTSGPELWRPEERPASGTEVHDVDEWLNAVAVGGTVGIAAEGTVECRTHPGVRYVRVSDAPAATVYLLRPVHPTHPGTEEFVAAVRTLVSQ
ncbi:LysR family transcriptional regulator [Streptomyces cinnamoneus]|uniref:LysR family transcriptional regulator n=1 Tax=Streptomyces cinnamoneus TaxID=53446 RepID=A0A2G1XJT4_STRCJ|nr:LysR family transcriptional regulator [Streptomyces cinnamoneus]PHQ51487.1 LysR family transcriptional regulator [Streptomyces cinnamoneus]PPT11669.1 LysR family transcriptional regulator [Streptomyces cinnamoneus]